MKRFFHIPLLLVMLTLLCAAVLAQNPNGDPIERGAEVNDQRAGSMLIYNYYTSNVTAAGVWSDTRITLTNTNETQWVQIKLYFMAGYSGQPMPIHVTLVPGQTWTFSTVDFDPGIDGYIMAMAVNNEGIPTQFDFLMGSAKIKLRTGHQATLGALAVPIMPNTYIHAALPRQLAVDQISSPSDDVKQLLVINRIDGSLYSGMPAIGALEFDVFNQDGARFSFTSRSLGPQARIYYYNSVDFGYTSNYLYNHLPAGQSGWLRMRPTGEGAITGAVLHFRETGGTTVLDSGGYNLRHLTNTKATLEVPTGMMEFGN